MDSGLVAPPPLAWTRRMGSEAMREASEVYNYGKTAAKTTPGLKPIAEQLGERFKQAHKKKHPEHAEQPA